MRIQGVVVPKLLTNVVQIIGCKDGAEDVTCRSESGVENQLHTKLTITQIGPAEALSEALHSKRRREGEAIVRLHQGD
jgi:hypothetical protein